jgi:hypothetical protein
VSRGAEPLFDLCTHMASLYRCGTNAGGIVHGEPLEVPGTSRRLPNMAKWNLEKCWRPTR